MFTVTMTFYVSKSPDGLYHVQNAVGGYLGQHHVHTKESYEAWSRDLDNIEVLGDAHCDCGLAAGQVRDHTGKVWSRE